MEWPTGLLFVLIMVLIYTPEYLYPYLSLYYLKIFCRFKAHKTIFNELLTMMYR